MPANDHEIQRRKEAALFAIRKDFVTDEDEDGATLFVSHHLDELEQDYWQKYLGSSRPEPTRILDILELRSHWGDEEENGIDTFDFSLPGDITNYVISVRFDESGSVAEVTMES